MLSEPIYNKELYLSEKANVPILLDMHKNGYSYSLKTLYRVTAGLMVILTFTAAKGTVTLPENEKFTSGDIQCGLINSKWVPGRLISGGKFYSITAERKDILKKAKNASESKKQTLTNKAKTLKNKYKTEEPVCRPGPTSVTPTPSPTPTQAVVTPAITLNKINDNLYNTEHSIFIIPTAGQVDWDSASSWDSLYSSANIDSYLATLRAAFLDDYFFVVITASNLLPNRVPNVLTYRQIASGIGQVTSDPAAANICRYHSEGTVTESIYAVLDHEVGHNWGVFIGSELAVGHWKSNSTEHGLMSENYTDDDFATIKSINGNPSAGFTWTSEDNLTVNENEIYSDGDLYLQGLGATFPDIHVLDTPTYNANGTVSYNSVASYNQAFVEGRHGVRSPSYRTSPKRFRFGFIYVARNLEEIQQSYIPVEKSIRQYVEAESIDTNKYRFQIPFLVTTKFRGSIDARLADLDGNAAPDIAITGAAYTTTTNGTASFNFTVTDTNGDTPAVSCVPASNQCSISGNTLNLTGLTAGAHFFTIKATDSGGKKSFAHVVVDAS